MQKTIQTYGIQQIVETKAGKKKWRQVIISKIKPKLLSDRLGEAWAKSLDTEIRDDYVKFFDWLKKRAVSNAREHKRNLDLQSPRARSDRPSSQKVSIRRIKKLKPTPSNISSLGKKQGEKRLKAEKGKGDDPRCFKCGSTDHLIADCPGQVRCIGSKMVC